METSITASAIFVNDTLGLDGVNCASCHAIDSTVGTTFSGIIPYDTTRHIYGPFTLPEVGPMQLYEGYTPTFSTHGSVASMFFLSYIDNRNG
ncbi:MAG: hypothetical protein IPG90_13400 [Bacteroidetes bacterium]|nr:hypothetical protein [Bacteroidota bacterium]